MRAKSGTLLSSREGIKDRLFEHFDELLKRPPTLTGAYSKKLEQSPIIEEFDEPIKLEEAQTAIRNTNLRKSSGPK